MTKEQLEQGENLMEQIHKLKSILSNLSGPVSSVEVKTFPGHTERDSNLICEIQAMITGHYEKVLADLQKQFEEL